ETRQETEAQRRGPETDHRGHQEAVGGVPCEESSGEVGWKALEKLAMPGFRLMAILGAALFSGAAIYINLVEHPARMECGTRLAATVFGPSYRRAALMQVILALLAAVGGAGAWLTGAPWKWLLGAVFILAVIPYTLL